VKPTHRIPIPIHADQRAESTALHVGRGAIGRLADILAADGVALAGRRVLLVADGNVSVIAAQAAASLAAAGGLVATVEVVATEARKSLTTVEEIWHVGLAHRLGRSGLVVAVGGGVTGDVVGFAAATFLRGVELVQVPTTLLAMVDAAIGGKTGINLSLPDGGLGKNLAGAFWQPRLTVADPDALRSLPARELRAGLAECIKHAVLAGEPLFGALEDGIEAIVAGDSVALERLLPEIAAVKIGIVVRDPLERGERALLNLGHTFGHAIETLPGVDLLHGEAVAIGMVAACRCALARGLIAPSDADRIERLIARAGLPLCLPPCAVVPGVEAEILRRMGFDKKVDGASIRLILPHGIGKVRAESVELAAAAREGSVQAAIDAIAGRG
jgi:3-dehydroquinate synthase